MIMSNSKIEEIIALLQIIAAFEAYQNEFYFAYYIFAGFSLITYICVIVEAWEELK